MSRSESVPLPEAIDRFIRDELTQRGGEACALDIRELHCKKHGRFFSVDLSGAAGGRLFLKQRDHGAYQSEGLRPEFDALQRIAAMVDDTPLAETIPRPFALDTEHNILAVAHVPGRDRMRAFYLSAVTGLRLAETGRWLAATGEWLGRFQRTTATGREIALADEIALARETAGSLALLDARVRERLIAALDDARDASLPEVEVHGDFALRNLLVSGADDLRVIDWEHAVPGHAAVDVCELIGNLMLPARYGAGMRSLSRIAGEFVTAWWAEVRDPLALTERAAHGALVAGTVARLEQRTRTGVGGPIWRRVFDLSARVVLDLDFADHPGRAPAPDPANAS